MTNRRITLTLLGITAAATLILTSVPTPAVAAEKIARPSNSGGPGEAAMMSGDAQAGAKLFAVNCMPCHGAEGKGGIPNPGSTDGTVPPLNPIDETMVSKDPKVFAYNIDLFIQNGSTPEGNNPAIKMPSWGVDRMLTQQQITDLIAYLMSLNPAP
jgi:mono/diheme cytochrome c family protein